MGLEYIKAENTLGVRHATSLLGLGQSQMLHLLHNLKLLTFMLINSETLIIHVQTNNLTLHFNNLAYM